MFFSIHSLVYFFRKVKKKKKHRNFYTLKPQTNRFSCTKITVKSFSQKKAEKKKKKKRGEEKSRQLSVLPQCLPNRIHKSEFE